MACPKCGSDRFMCYQVCRHDIVVNDRNDYVEGLTGDSDADIYDAETPYGPYTCMRCKTPYDTLPTIREIEITPVEMVRGFMDKTWDTVMMDVPGWIMHSEEGTLEERLTKEAERLFSAGHLDISFFTVYHIGEPTWVPLEELDRWLYWRKGK